MYSVTLRAIVSILQCVPGNTMKLRGSYVTCTSMMFGLYSRYVYQYHKHDITHNFDVTYICILGWLHCITN